MERKRTSSGPPITGAVNPQPIDHRRVSLNGYIATSPVMSTSQSVHPPPPTSSSSDMPPSFGFPAPVVNTNGHTPVTRKWRPERKSGGRHNSPLYGKHRKRPSSSSIDSNVSWSGSEIESIGDCSAAYSEQQEHVTSMSWVSSTMAKEEAPSTGQQDLAPAASLFGAPPVDNKMHVAAVRNVIIEHENKIDVQPCKMPLCKSTLDCAGEKEMDSREGSHANSSDNVFVATSATVYDDETDGPRSCPLTFNNERQPQFSIDKLRQLRSNELIASKLLPTRNSVDSLMGYVRELQLSETTLRKQLMTNKQHTEEKLTHSLSKVSELERTVQEIERDRELARQKLEEQEQLIRDLAAKLKHAEAARSKDIIVSNELPPIAEEAGSQRETGISAAMIGENSVDVLASAVTPAMQQHSSSMFPVYHDQPQRNNSGTQFELAPPDSPDRPLWDPWTSGGANAMKNLPPVFTIGSARFDPAVSASPQTGQMPTDSKTTSAGEYELKSVLLSPRQKQRHIDAVENDGHVQPVVQNDVTVAPFAQQDYTQRDCTATFAMGAMPSPMCPHEQGLTSTGKTNAARGMQSKGVPPVECSSQTAVPMVPVALISSPIGNTMNANLDTERKNEVQGQQSASVTSCFVSAEKARIEEKAPTVSLQSTELTTVLLPAYALVSNDQLQSSEPQADTCKDAQVTPSGQESCFATGYVVSRSPSTLPPGSSSSLSPASLANQTHSPASAPIQSIADTTKPVSLETLLVEFFTEVDNKRLKMAKVYGKRYAGREKWLFAELTKRYGAAKVATLKARYEKGSGGEAFSVSNHDMSMNDHHATSLSDVSSHTKAGRQGHSRHPQFLHPATPGNNVAYSASAGVSAVSSPVASLQAESCSQARQVAEETDTSSGHSGRTPADPVLSQPRQSGGNILPLTGVPPSFSNLPETGEKGDRVTAVGTGGPSSTSTPIETTRHGEPNGQVNQLPFCSQTGTEDSNSAGLRQRHQSSRHSEPRTGIERPAVTLESLLKELYKNHQPDKLKNVSIVAKQYAGRERELVRLLKGKYGAFSVKRFEENLDVLERAHRARIGNRGVGKKRGCWARTISLMFWLSLLLYFSFGAVLVSIVLLDAWECRSFDSEKQELEVADDCRPLKKELETFTYERIAAYVSQSHSDACFCLEWKARESAVFGTFAGADLVKLVMLVPFSPASFGASWMATVKEYIPPQESYDSYAKPVVDLLLDAGSFMWFSVVELTGYDEILEKSSVATNVIANNSNEVPSVDEDGASDALVGLHPQAAEMEDERITGNLDDDIAVTKEAHVVENEGVVAAFGAVEQVPVEEEVVSFDEKLNLGDAVNDDRVSDVTDNVLVESENVISDVSKDMTTANKEDSSLLSKVEITKHTMVESTTMLELEDVAPVEATESMAESMAESIDGSEQELSHEVEAESTWTEDDSVSTLTEEVEPVGGMDDGTSAFTETEEEDVVAEEKAFFNDVEKETAAEVSDDVSLEYAVAEDVAVESESVVEAEVREEGFDLSYPEVELDDALNAEFAEMSVDNESEPLFGSGEEPFASNEDAGVAGTEDVSDGVFVSSSEEDVASVMRDVDESLDLSVSNSADADIEVMSLDSDVSTAASEASGNEADNIEKEAMNIEGLQIKPSAKLSHEIDIGTNEYSNTANVKKLALDSVSEDVTVDLLSGMRELEVGTEKLDTIRDVQGTETTFNGEKEVSFDEVDANVVVEEEEALLAKSEHELSNNPNDVDVEVLLAEKGTILSLDGEYVGIKEESDDDYEKIVAPGETNNVHMSVSIDDEKVLEEKYEEEETGDNMVISEEAEVENELELEEYVGDAPIEEVVVHELEETWASQEFDLKRGVEKAEATSAEIDAAGEELNLPSEVEVENFEEVANEIDDVGDTNAESTTWNEFEEKQSMSQFDLVNEQGEGFVANEAAVSSGGEGTVSAEHAEEVNEHVEDDEAVGFSLTEASSTVTDGVRTRIATDVENVIMVDEEEHVNNQKEAAAALEADPITNQVNVMEDHEVMLHVDVQPVVDKSSAHVIEEESYSGFASTMNEVLARLVEPFEAAKTAKTAVHVVVTGREHEVDEL